MAYEEQPTAASEHIEKIREGWGFSDGNIPSADRDQILKSYIAILGLCVHIRKW
jgi:hypothetical protein